LDSLSKLNNHIEIQNIKTIQYQSIAIKYNSSKKKKKESKKEKESHLICRSGENARLFRQTVIF
jgi:uncharacterized protein (DUF169 family)